MNKTASLLPGAFLLLLAACNGSAKTDAPAPSAPDSGSVSVSVDARGASVSVKTSGAAPATTTVTTAAPAAQSAEAELPGGANNWDQVLDDYEQYIKEFEGVKRDLESGTVNEGNEHALLDRGEALQASLVKARTSKTLTPAQERRFRRLQARMASMAVPTNFNMEDN